jgi:hypothetical protein
MTPEQAEEFFKRYNGSSFHMSREEPQQFAVFNTLEIPDAQKDLWRLEIARDYIDKIAPDDPKSWSYFSSLTAVLSSITTFKDKQESMLLEGIRKQSGCDEWTRMITLETICGRTSDHHDGVIAYFRKQHYDLRKLKEVSDKLFESDTKTENARFEKAVRLYRSLITG